MPRAEFGVSERDRTVRTPEKDAGPAVIVIRVREERHLRLLLKGEREQGFKKKKRTSLDSKTSQSRWTASVSPQVLDSSGRVHVFRPSPEDKGGAAVAERSRTERRGAGESQSRAKPTPRWSLREPRCPSCSGSSMGPKTRREQDGAENLLRRFQRTLGEPEVTFILLSLRPPPKGVPCRPPAALQG